MLDGVVTDKSESLAKFNFLLTNKTFGAAIPFTEMEKKKKKKKKKKKEPILFCFVVNRYCNTTISRRGGEQ